MELLKKLYGAIAPSGNEGKIGEIIANEAKKYCDSISVDVLGNVICHKKGAGKKLMLCAHMDEIGFIVTNIDEKGFINFANVGGHSPLSVVNQQVIFENGTVGVISYDKKVKAGDLKLRDCYIDLGMEKADVEKVICIGDMAVFNRGISENKDVFIGNSLDDKIGCYIMLRTMAEIKKSEFDLYFVFTVQEEVGLRGAKTSAFMVDPDVALAIDVTSSGDTPGCDVTNTKMGGGCAIKLKDAGIITHQRVKNWLINSAKEEKIPYQLDVMQAGATDVGAISLNKAGVMCGGLSVATRYIHTSNEMVAKKDVEAAIDLLVKAIEKDTI